MNLSSLLTKINTIIPKMVKFFFGSKWTIPVVIVVIVLYFIWIGSKKEKKVEELEEYEDEEIKREIRKKE